MQKSQEQHPPTAPVGRKRLIAFGLLMVIALVVLFVTPLRELRSVDNLRQRALDLGPWAPLSILVIGAIGPCLLLPRWPIAFVSGFLYGLTTGCILGNIAGSLGALVHFYVALHLLAPSTREMCRKRNINVDNFPADRVFLVIFILRAFPFSSTVVTNLVASALHVRARTYISATFLGMIPSSLIYAASGSLVHAASIDLYIAICISLCFFGLIGWTGRKTIRLVFGKST